MQFLQMVKKNQKCAKKFEALIANRKNEYHNMGNKS